MLHFFYIPFVFIAGVFTHAYVAALAKKEAGKVVSFITKEENRHKL